MKRAGATLMLLLLLGLAGGAVWRFSRTHDGPRAVSGTIETDEVRIASRYGGRVINIFAQEGDPLTPAQVVVELDATELPARRDNIAAQLSELEHGPRTNEVDAAKAQWESLIADWEFAKAEAKRAAELFGQKVISETERDNATSRANALAQRAEVARRQHALLVEGTRPERIAQARAQLAEVETQLREMKINAPTNSVLEVLSVKVGDVVPANREVATLLLPQHLWVRVYVPETWLTHIKPGQEVDVRVDGSRDKQWHGTVEQISRQAEFTPRNVQTTEERIKQVFGVKVRLPADTGLLRAGMAADVFFPNVPEPPK